MVIYFCLLFLSLELLDPPRLARNSFLLSFHDACVWKRNLPNETYQATCYSQSSEVNGTAVMFVSATDPFISQ